jgi:hypothetical protein
MGVGGIRTMTTEGGRKSEGDPETKLTLELVAICSPPESPAHRHLVELQLSSNVYCRHLERHRLVEASPGGVGSWGLRSIQGSLWFLWARGRSGGRTSSAALGESCGRQRGGRFVPVLLGRSPPSPLTAAAHAPGTAPMAHAQQGPSPG